MGLILKKFKNKLEITPWIAEGHDNETQMPAYQKGLETYEKYQDLFDWVMPCVWACQKDGTFKDNTTLTGELRLVSDKYRKPWVPLIAGACELVNEVVTNPELSKRNIRELVSLMREAKCSGVDVDYEFLPKDSRFAFTGFVRDLSEALHSEGMFLAVDLHPKVRPDDPWSIGAQAQDYKELARYADIMHVMCYDQHHFAYFYSDPGPVSTPAWTDAVVNYAAMAIPPEKLVIGLPTYGFDWNLTSPDKTKCIFYEQVKQRMCKYDASDRIDGVTGQPFFNYTDETGDEHIVWYEDVRSLSNKFDVLSKYSMRGLAFWVLTLEDQRIWSELSSRLLR